MTDAITIPFHEVKVGMEITIHKIENGYRSWGQGGKVTELSATSLVMVSGTAGIRNEFDPDYLIREFDITTDVPSPASDCVSHGPECKGPVDWHTVGNGTPIKRCEFHWEVRLRVSRNSIERYADSATAPSWFDPANAGESWDED